jgi:hypothetical protein
MFWACSALPCNAASATIHNVSFFIGDSCFSLIK